MDKDDKIEWMFCTQCKKTVLLNNSGICFRCQGKYTERTQPDSWTNMHTCKKCGNTIIFLSKGCEDCDVDDAG